MKRKLTAALIVLLAVCLGFWVSGCAGPPAQPTPTAEPEPAYDNSVVTPSPGYTPTPEASNTPLDAPGIVVTVEKIAPCVVTILTEWVDYSYFLQPTPYRGAGSGVIFTQDGYIVTNGHVVENAKDIKVILPDGSFFAARLVGVDSFTDLAVIKVDAHSLPVANFGDSKALHLGQPVIAIGNAFDLPGGHTVTLGIVSALGRSIKTYDGIILHDLIQTDAAINPGNSGGPLLTLDGKVIGINTARIGGGAENIGFAVSSATIEPVIEQLVRHGKIIWPWLGIEAVTLTPALTIELNLSVKQGVLVDEVYNGGPADKAGLQKGDVVVSVAGEQVATVLELQNTVRKHGIGQEVEVSFIRDYRTQKVDVTLQQIPKEF